VIVAPVDDKQSVAFAIDKAWPHGLLQVDWIDRKSGRTEEIAIAVADVSLLKTEKLKSIYFDAKNSKIAAEQ
jgi:hypothetical protein